MNKNINQSGFYLLSDNEDAFTARFTLASIAEKTLDVQYYIIHNDASGQYLAYALLAAADRGVHVRILVDDINLGGSDSSLKMLGQHENIEIRIFNPLLNRHWFRRLELVLNLNRAGRRMHNKTFIVDNSTAIVGGRNIGDEYFDARHSLNFVDLDLLTIGNIVNDISNSFNDYWCSHWASPVETLSKTSVVKKQLIHIRQRLKDKWHRAKNTEYFHSIKYSDFTQSIINKKLPFIWANATLFYDPPEKLCESETDKIVHFGPQLMPFFEQSKNEILIVSPYFVPGKTGLDWFINKNRQGVNIKILTNSLEATDVPVVHAGYKKYRQQLVDAGIHLFELKTKTKNLLSKTRRMIKGEPKTSLHAKYMVADQHYVFIGSANLDPRSALLNTEIGILIDSEELAQQTSALFNKAASLENSYRLEISNRDNKLRWLTKESAADVNYRHEPKVGYLKRFFVYIIGLLPIESLL